MGCRVTFTGCLRRLHEIEAPDRDDATPSPEERVAIRTLLDLIARGCLVHTAAALGRRSVSYGGCSRKRRPPPHLPCTDPHGRGKICGRSRGFRCGRLVRRATRGGATGAPFGRPRATGGCSMEGTLLPGAGGPVLIERGGVCCAQGLEIRLSGSVYCT